MTAQLAKLMVAGLVILVACSTPDEATSDTEADVPAAASSTPDEATSDTGADVPAVASSTSDEATSDTGADVPAAATQQVTCDEYLTTYLDVGAGLDISVQKMSRLITDYNADFITAEEIEPQVLTIADELREMAGTLEVLVVPEPLVEDHPERMAVAVRTFANMFDIAAELFRSGTPTSEENLYETMDAAVKQLESVRGRMPGTLRACDDAG